MIFEADEDLGDAGGVGESASRTTAHPTMAAPTSQIEAALPALDSPMRRRLGWRDEEVTCRYVRRPAFGRVWGEWKVGGFK